MLRTYANIILISKQSYNFN